MHPKPISLSQRISYSPSQGLVDIVIAALVAEASGDDQLYVLELRAEARRHLTHAILGLLNTMASSLQYAGEPAPHAFAATGEFPEPIRRAFLLRVRVPESSQNAFFSVLHDDIEQAAGRGEVWGPFWSLEATGVNRELDLRVQPSEPAIIGPLRERAQVVRMPFAGRRD